MVHKFIQKLAVSIFIILVSFFLSSKVSASGVVWHKSEGIDSPFSQEIKIAPSNANIVYATIRTSTGSGLFKSENAGHNFYLILPVVQNKDINSIAISYSNADRVWIGTYEEGIFKSINGGTTWISTTGILPKRIRYITVDPSNDNILYAGTGVNNGDGGIYKSSNGGDTWSQIGNSSFGNKNCLNILVNQYNSSIIYAGSDYGLYRSNDSGVNWTQVNGFNTNVPATLVDRETNSIIYASVPDQGLFKSINSGSSWNLKNNTMGNSIIFRLAQAPNNDLFAGRVNYGGGIWKSIDKAEHWENISDTNPSWNNKSIRGLDVSYNNLIVGVQDVGVFYTDLNLSPPPQTPLPLIFLPGFGGSWSYKGIIENQPTTPADWKLMPVFTDTIYQPLLTTLTNAGAIPQVFAYDFRKTVADNAINLNTFLTTKSNIVAHSMGGLVAKKCFEDVPGCATKINKIATFGSPFKGTLQAYPLWEAGEFGHMDLVNKLALEIILHATSFPYLTDKDIIQNKFPGVFDLLPKTNLTSPENMLSFYGKNNQTWSGFNTVNRSKMEEVLGLWNHGKPGVYSTDIGDGSVLKSSAQLTNNKEYNLAHNDYFKNATSLIDLLNYFELTPGTIVTTATNPTSIMAFIIHSPATISTAGQAGSEIFILNPVGQNYPVTITGTGNGSYQLDAFFISQSRTSKRTFNGNITTGATQIVNFDFSPGYSQDFNDLDGAQLLASFRKKVAQNSNRNLKVIEATVIAAVKNKSVRTLESSYGSCITLLISENSLKDTCNQLLNLTVKINQLYGSNPSYSVTNTEIIRAQKSINNKNAKISLSFKEAVNLQQGQQFLVTANQLLGTSNHRAKLLSTGAIILTN